MEEKDIVEGSCMMERVACTNICERHFSRHLSCSLINRHFRAMFGVSSRTAHLLWFTLDVDTLGPQGGKRIHLLWMLMFLKEYCTQDTLSGICRVTRKTFRQWVDIFLERVSNLNLVSVIDVDTLYVVYCVMILSEFHSIVYFIVQIKFENRHLMADPNQ